jgi:hypothetical protein
MKLNEIFLFERYVNLIGDDPRKDQYKDEVYSILTRSYEKMGGLKGSGTESPEALKSIPFWKLVRKDNRIVAVVLYKDKNGRKSVAVGTDGSKLGMKAVEEITKAEPSRSYSEKSKASLNFFMKNVDNPEKYIIPVSDVQKISKDHIIPFNSVNVKDWPVDEEERNATLFTLKRYPQLAEYGYFRDIGDSYYFKVMVGTPNKTID